MKSEVEKKNSSEWENCLCDENGVMLLSLLEMGVRWMEKVVVVQKKDLDIYRNNRMIYFRKAKEKKNPFKT